MREERRQSVKSKIKIEVKRSTELWLYSFADLYMIIAVLFIATTALYAKKAKDASRKSPDPPRVVTMSAGRGPATAALAVAIEFGTGSSELSQEAIEQLTEVLPLFSEMKSGVVDVEGYADTQGLAKNSEFASNLALSSERAVTVAQWFLTKGISESRVRTTGFGRAHRFTNGEHGVNSDRRVVVKFYSVGPS